MKLSFVILIHFFIVFPVVAQEYPAKYYGGNENLEGPFKYEMGQVFGAWETYYLYFDKTTNNIKGYFYIHGVPMPVRLTGKANLKNISIGGNIF